MQNKQIFIGLDMAKVTFTAAMVTENNPSVFNEERFSNDKKGYLKLLSWIDQCKYNRDQTLICLEHTGVYSKGLGMFLAEKGVSYSLLSGLHLKRSLGIRRGKSDKADAKDIARYALNNRRYLKQTVLPEQIIVRLKDKLAERQRVVKARKMLATPISEKKSVGLKTPKSEHRQSLSLITHLTKAIQLLNKEIESIIKSDEKLKNASDLLCSIPGIGPQIAAELLVVTNSFANFENSRKLACYVGIAPFEYTSGTSIKGKTKVSHLADKNLKSLLTMAALNAMRCDRELKIYYNRKLAEGKHFGVVINAIKNKILARAFAVVKRGTPYAQMATYAN